MEEQVLFFDVLVHVGTLVGLLAVFAADFWFVIRRPTSKLTLLLVAGLIPTALIGFFFKDSFARLYATGETLGLEFLVTGLILWFAEKAPRGTRNLAQMSWGDAFFVGTMQGLAILPALSRSGLTIAGALFRHLDRETAARYSFLLSAPAILGAGLVELKDIDWGATLALPFLSVFLGTLAAALSGYFAVRIMLRILTQSNLKPFSYYVWVLGLLILGDQIFFHFFFGPPPGF